MSTELLRVEDVAVGRNDLAMRFAVGDLRFNSTYWYEGLDFDALAAVHGKDVLRKIVFHVAAFEVNKLASLRPDCIDFGPYRDLVTSDFWNLWTTVWRHVAGEWRYENDDAEYVVPDLAHGLAPEGPGPTRIGNPNPRVLAFVGGGKDSLVAMRLLDDAGITYDTLGYSHSVYGTAEFQHGLLERLVRHGARAQHHHRQWIFDDFLDSPVVRLRPDLGVSMLTAAETPSSLFGAIPLALARSLDTLIVGHERSADMGNLIWERTGEEINHQWGKSIDAEGLLARYVRDQLVADLVYTSVLKPVRDPVIFTSLTHMTEAVPDTHSCNVRKPWCEECPKCAYVWLNYAAYLPGGVPAGMFRTNLADNPVNDRWFREMLGLSEHTPFECVGQVPEATLALHLAAGRGLRGAAIDRYLPHTRASAATGDLFGVPATHHTMPPGLAERVVPILQGWAAQARHTVDSLRRAA